MHYYEAKNEGENAYDSKTLGPDSKIYDAIRHMQDDVAAFFSRGVYSEGK